MTFLSILIISMQRAFGSFFMFSQEEKVFELFEKKKTLETSVTQLQAVCSLLPPPPPPP